MDNNYTRIKKTIQINLNNVHINEKLREVYSLTSEDGNRLTEKLEIDIVDMVIGRRNCYTKNKTKLDRWCLVFTAKTRKEFEETLEGLMELEAKEKLVEEVDKYSSNNQVIALYSKYTREELEHNTLLIEAREEAIKQGIEQGKTENSIEIAKNLKEMGIVSIEDICKATGLSKNDIEIL